MPDPRSVPFTTEILFGNSDGTGSGIDDYGRRPWQPDYGKTAQDSKREWRTFHRFCGEFARLVGPYRKGRAHHMVKLDDEKDSDWYHQSILNGEKAFAKKKKKKAKKK